MKNKYMENEHLSLILFILIFTTYAIVYMTKNCYSAAMVYLVEDNVLTKSQTGTINSVFYLVYAPFQIIGGMVADKRSPYVLISIGLLGAALSNFLILVVQSYHLILIICAFNGAIQFGIWPGVFKIVSQSLAPAHRLSAIFYITLASTAGLVLSYLVAGMVSGWRGNFIVAASSLIITFVVWVILGRFLGKKMVCEEPQSHGVAHLPEVKKYDNEPADNFLITVFKSGLIILLPVVVIKSLFAFGIQAVIPTMIRESYNGISSSLASILAIVPILAGLAGKFILQRIYKNKIYNECITIALIMSVMLPFVIMMLLIGKINVILIVCIISAVVMLSNTANTVSIPYVSMRFVKMGRNATVSGLTNAMSSLGIVTANLVSPRIADSYGWISVINSWIIFALAAILLSGIAYIPWNRFIKKTK